VYVEFIKSDLFNNIKNKKFDFIVSNPPYIKSEDIKFLDREVQHDPMLALDGGKDGLIFYKKIIEKSPQFLNDGGYKWAKTDDYEYNKPVSNTKYLNLKPEVNSWTVYKTNKYYNPKKDSDILMKVNPKKFNGLSYKIYEDMGNYHFKIKTVNNGYGYIAGNPNKYSCTITDKPTYKNGNY